MCMLVWPAGAGSPHHPGKGCLSNKTVLAMVFKLVDGAQKTWRRLNGPQQLPKIIQGVKFTDGFEVAATDDQQAQTAAA
jgi:putative transposase